MWLPRHLCASCAIRDELRSEDLVDLAELVPIDEERPG